MRSFVQTPMRHGRLFLAGDAAHIVPPTGAKGLNLAVADVALLAPALVAWLRKDDASLADAYADTAVRRVWRCTHFSWWMTTMLHATGDPFDEQLQLSQLALGHLQRGRRHRPRRELRGVADRVLRPGTAGRQVAEGDRREAGMTVDGYIADASTWLRSCDDEPNIAELLRIWFEPVGWDVATASQRTRGRGAGRRPAARRGRCST